MDSYKCLQAHWPCDDIDVYATIDELGDTMRTLIARGITESDVFLEIWKMVYAFVQESTKNSPDVSPTKQIFLARHIFLASVGLPNG